MKLNTGLFFALAILAACGAPATPPGSTPDNSASPSPGTSPGASASPAASSPASVSGFTFLGVDTDKVMSGPDVSSDGKNDLHFAYSHNFGTETEIHSIRVVFSINGTPAGNIGWNTAPGTLWVLGVDINGQPALSRQAALLGKRVTGNVRFDFYGSQAGVESVNLPKAGNEYTLLMEVINPNGGNEETIKLSSKIK